MPPEIGQAVTLMLALFHASVTHAWCGEYTAANAQADEVANFVRSKRHWYWKAYGSIEVAYLHLPANPRRQSNLSAPGLRHGDPRDQQQLARAYGERGQYDDALRCIVDAMKAAERKCRERPKFIAPLATSHCHRLNRMERRRADFERAIVIVREQHAKSWELRAAMSMVRLWCDQGKQRQGHDIHKT
jgi:hypothetical protein